MSEITITVLDNGPYAVPGPPKLVIRDGTPIDTGDRETVYLCRCGQSSNKPFCDGTHGKVGFDGTLASS